MQALVACPTASIGAASAAAAREAAGDFPLPVDGGVFYCGYASPHSYGAASYFVVHPDGNWLVDSPRWTERLARRFEELGGIRHVFLTHRDDVAAAGQYARRFGARRIIHRFELDAQPDAETVLDGRAPVPLAPDFLAIPTPGHTRGHTVLLYRGRYLFSGDHLWWSRTEGRLAAGRGVCWYSWREQADSMARLAAYGFEWVLPGHGQRARIPAGQARPQVAALAGRMRGHADAA